MLEMRCKSEIGLLFPESSTFPFLYIVTTSASSSSSGSPLESNNGQGASDDGSGVSSEGSNGAFSGSRKQTLGTPWRLLEWSGARWVEHTLASPQRDRLEEEFSSAAFHELIGIIDTTTLDGRNESRHVLVAAVQKCFH